MDRRNASDVRLSAAARKLNCSVPNTLTTVDLAHKEAFRVLKMTGKLTGPKCSRIACLSLDSDLQQPLKKFQLVAILQ